MSSVVCNGTALGILGLLSWLWKNVTTSISCAVSLSSRTLVPPRSSNYCLEGYHPVEEGILDMCTCSSLFHKTNKSINQHQHGSGSGSGSGSAAGAGLRCAAPWRIASNGSWRVAFCKASARPLSPWSWPPFGRRGDRARHGAQGGTRGDDEPCPGMGRWMGAPRVDGAPSGLAGKGG